MRQTAYGESVVVYFAVCPQCFTGNLKTSVACIILSGSCKSTGVTFALWPWVSDCTNPLPMTTGRPLASV